MTKISDLKSDLQEVLGGTPDPGIWPRSRPGQDVVEINNLGWISGRFWHGRWIQESDLGCVRNQRSEIGFPRGSGSAGPRNLAWCRPGQDVVEIDNLRLDFREVLGGALVPGNWPRSHPGLNPRSEVGFGSGLGTATGFAKSNRGTRFHADS